MKDKKWVGAGFGVIMIKDNKILLSKRHEDPKKASSLLNGAGTWTMPGGKLHFGESFEEGLFSDNFEGEPQVMEPDEITEWQWFDLNNLPEKMFFPSAKILENYKKKEFYIKQ